MSSAENSPGGDEAPKIIRTAIVSVVKHDYVPKGMLSHKRFEPVVVTDDADQPDWIHQRNQKFADEFDVPYVRDLKKAFAEFLSLIHI